MRSRSGNHVVSGSFALALLLFGLLPLAIAQTLSSTSHDLRGPVAGWEGKTQVDEQGVQAVHYSYVPPEDGAPWQPEWVWVQSSKQAGNGPRAAHFRKELVLPAGVRITSAYAKVSADQIYRLWVNGRLVSRGPDDPGNDVIGPGRWSHQWLYNRLDLAPFLHGGTNVIAAEVLTSDLLPSYSLGHPGFAFQATVVRAQGAPVVVATGSTWKAEACEAYSEGPVGTSLAGEPAETALLYDARLDDPSWREASFSTKEWANATPVDSVWGTLHVSQISPSMEAVWPAQSISRATPNVTTTAPLARLGENIRMEGDGAFSVGYDRVLSGYVSIRVRGAAGTVITIRPAETKTAPHPRRSMQVTLRDGETIFEYPALDSFSSIKVMVSHATQPVEFADVQATFVSQPVAYRGSFESSDAFLNRLWKMARWQLQICMQNRYLDSPNHQEPIGDPGDYLIESLENDYAFQEPWLTRQDLRKFASMLDHSGETNFHTSYALLWLQMLMDFYDYTGDEALLRELRPTANRLLDHFSTFRGANGLLSEAPNYMFMDWVTIGGFPVHHPPAVIGQGYLTAFYYRALADGARIATIVGDDARKAKYEQLRRETKAAFERELWDEKAGLYRDGKPYQNHQPRGQWLPEDKDIETHSPHVNSLAVLYDLAPKDRQQAIMNRLFLSPPLNVQPYFMHFVFAAEDHAGVFDRYAWTQLQRWHMNPETRTFPEDWNEGDLSHAWGGTPLIQMPARILGVTPAAPGFKRVAIRPHLSGLSWSKGVVPTPMGDVQVSWTKTDAAFTLDVTAPTEMGIDVSMPTTDFADAALVIDGRQAFPEAKITGQTLTLKGGTHRLIMQSRRAPF